MNSPLELTTEEKKKLAIVRQAKLEILFTTKDKNGNFLIYNNGRLNLRIATEDRNRIIGDIYYVNDLIVYKKFEAIGQIFKSMNAWSISEIIASNVDVIWYRTASENYWITTATIKQLLKEGEAKIMKFEGVELKVYVPLKYWSPDPIMMKNPDNLTLLDKNPVEGNDPDGEAKGKRYENRVGYAWSKVLYDTFETPYMKSLGKNLNAARGEKIIYPEPENVFRAFRCTPYDKVKVVMLGQEPYLDGEATGLAFECPTSQLAVPSYSALARGYDEQYPANFNTAVMDKDLHPWTEEGVLLLNTALTSEKRTPGKHLKHWSPFIQEVIRVLNEKPVPVVYILIGMAAETYKTFIDSKCPVLVVEHPVKAVSEKRNWNHQNCFLWANEELNKLKITPVNW